MQLLSSEKRTKEKSKKFWFVDWNYNSARCEKFFLNEDKILKHIGGATFSPPLERRGFEAYPEAPKVSFKCKSGKCPLDVEPFSGYWLVSQKAKLIFETLAPEAFAFCKCDAVLYGKSEELEYWICDVVLVLDAVDEEKSDIEIRDDGQSRKYYHYNIPRCVEFQREKIQNSIIFRIKHSESQVVCNDDFKLATRELKGLQFDPPKR